MAFVKFLTIYHKVSVKDSKWDFKEIKTSTGTIPINFYFKLASLYVSYIILIFFRSALMVEMEKFRMNHNKLGAVTGQQ